MTAPRASAHSVMELFRAVVLKKHRQDKEPHRFGTGEILFQSEMFLLEVIGENRGPSVTDLADQLGITKGAVSQTLKKLTRKKLVDKRIDPNNRARATLELTSAGKRAFLAHRNWHRAVDAGFKEYLGSLSDGQLVFLSQFLKRFERFIDAREPELD